MQAKLLHVIHSRSFSRVGGNRSIQVDIRIIAATNRDIEAMVSRGNFRDDLYYRINVLSITLPPLRERKEDLYLLVKYLLPKLQEKTGKKCSEISHEVMNIFFSYSWPGNVRELENVLESSCIMADGEIILPSHLPEYIKGHDKSAHTGYVDVKKLAPLKDLLQETENQAIIRALKDTGGHRGRAMEILGMGKTNFYKKLKHIVRDNELSSSQ